MRLRCTQWFAGMVAVLVLAGCGTTATTSGGASAPTGGGGSSPVPIEIPSASTMTIEDLPRATAPVVSGSGSNIAAAVTKASSSANGLNIVNVTTSSFTSSSSAAGCYAAISAQDVLASAASTDYQLCLIQSTVGAKSASELGFDLYDGGYHVVGLQWPGYTKYARVRVVRDTSVGITDFELNICAGITQILYSTQTISANSDGTRTVNARAIHTGDSSLLSDVTVSGTINTSHKFVSKSVYQKYNLNMVTPAQWCEGTATQTTDALTVNGACENSSSTGNAQRFMFQLYDNNASTDPASYTPKELAMGNGGMVARFGGSAFSLNQAWSWNGTTLVPATSANSYLTAARALTAATAPSQFTVGFTSAQTWGCSFSAEYTVKINEGALYDACGKYIDIAPRNRPSCDGLDSTATP